MSSHERDPTPEQQARVADLLASARADEPMPEDVAARLDGVLAGLGSESAEVPEVVAVDSRRRRRAGAMLVAAVAVVVAGVAVGQLVDPEGDDATTGAADDSFAEAPDRAASQERAGAAEDALPEAAQPTPYSGQSLSPRALEALGVPRPVSGRSFAADARRLQRHPGVRSVPGMMDGSDLAAPDRDFVCGAADFGPGKLVAVRYDGSPAVLAFREPHGDTQVVDLLQCGSGEVIRSTTLPTR